MKSQNPDQNESCPICLKEFKDITAGVEASDTIKNIVSKMKLNNKIVETVCGHAFHSTCLAEWSVIKKECPICRSKLFDEEL